MKFKSWNTDHRQNLLSREMTLYIVEGKKTVFLNGDELKSLKINPSSTTYKHGKPEFKLPPLTKPSCVKQGIFPLTAEKASFIFDQKSHPRNLHHCLYFLINI